MYPHLLKIQISMALLVAIGGYLLGSSINDSKIVMVSILGTITAFCVVDRWKWVDLSGWAANFVLVLILIYTMRDFFGGDSAEKLTSVAVMLSYLLIALCFQKKTSRLCWQIMVLSILQILEAAIFNLNFEFGIFFLLYFFVATFALIMQSDYVAWNRTQRENSRNRKLAKKQDLSVRLPNELAPAIVMSKAQTGWNLFSKFGLLFPLMVGSILFSFILFHSLPHGRQEWENKLRGEFNQTGASKSSEITTEGLITQSNSLIFRARFIDKNTEENIQVIGVPYFRGMAMSKLVVDNDGIRWEAPYDHVFERIDYQAFQGTRQYWSQNSAQEVKLEIVIEPTSDPLLYTSNPSYRLPSETEIEFCQPLSAITRRKSKMGSTIASFKYEVLTLLDDVKRPLQGFPYRSPDRTNNFPVMETGSPEYQLLTAHQADRFPELVKIAKRIAQQNSDLSRVELCRTLARHFSAENGYRYTLDYRNVDRNPSVNAVEDFVANHRSGHCTVYASALTLMLRSLGIPARYVVGFHGGRYNNLTDCYVMHGKSAHAWVEAYLPPSECSEEMFQSGMARRNNGAWLTLDPTPPGNDDDQPSQALDLARTIWQDYVISPDHNKQSYSPANSMLLVNNRNSRLFDRIEMVFSTATANPVSRISLVLLAISMFLYPIWQNQRQEKKTLGPQGVGNAIVNAIGQAIAQVSPNLANWWTRDQSKKIEFYERFEKLMNRHLGLKRIPEQTQLEFAQQGARLISSNIDNQEQSESAKKILQDLTDSFYQARFSSIDFEPNQQSEIDIQLNQLEQILQSNRVSNS